jgi:Domain of unknown function (DUF6950)
MITSGHLASGPPAPAERLPPKVERKPEWPRLLTMWIHKAQSQRFIWGSWDCCMAMCDGVRTIANVDPGARVRQQYTDQLGAARVVMRLTHVPWFEGAVAAELQYHGLIECPVDFAGRGDVVMGDSQDGPTWGLIDETGQRAVFAAQKGARWAAKAQCRRAWRVG